MILLDNDQKNNKNKNIFKHLVNKYTISNNNNTSNTTNN